MTTILTKPMNPTDFYDQLAPRYHEVYAGWQQSVTRQAGQLDKIIKTHARAPRSTLLDASCGIGTQAIGLAALGYQVSGSDISPASIRRARREARQHALHISFRVADMRRLRAAHDKEFDVVISCDNSLPHLLSDKQILVALRQMHACTRPGGLCLVTLRDYAGIDRTGIQFKPYGVVSQNAERVLLFQTWEFHGDIYTLSMYRVAERPGRSPRTTVLRTRYYAVSISTVARLMRQAGFASVTRIDNAFFQPVLVGKRRM
jgi:2-polyprenyl-3-methyl-5-hydroxy-6-metoxy-1,4-benzoquinol methylase